MALPFLVSSAVPGLRISTVCDPVTECLPRKVAGHFSVPLFVYSISMNVVPDTGLRTIVDSVASVPSSSLVVSSTCVTHFLLGSVVSLQPLYVRVPLSVVFFSATNGSFWEIVPLPVDSLHSIFCAGSVLIVKTTIPPATVSDCSPVSSSFSLAAFSDQIATFGPPVQAVNVKVKTAADADDAPAALTAATTNAAMRIPVSFLLSMRLVPPTVPADAGNVV